MRALKHNAMCNTMMYVEGERECVCEYWECLFVDEPWLELLADRLLLLLLLLLRDQYFSVRPESFLGAEAFYFLNEVHISTLSPQSADVF